MSLSPRRLPLILLAGVIGLGVGRPQPAPAQPPVTIRTPGLPEPGGDVTAAERVIDWQNYHRSGWEKMNRGWYDSAEREFLGAIRAARRTTGRLQTNLLTQSYASLAWALEQQGKAREAEPLARWVLDVWQAEYGAKSSVTARAINLMATIDLALGKNAEAEALLRPLVGLPPTATGTLDQEQARGQSLLGLALASHHDYNRAEVEYQKAVARREALRPRDEASLGDDWNNLAWCRIEQRKWPEARTAMTRALTLLEASRGVSDLTVARALDGLARIDAEQGDLGAAESKIRRAITIAEAGGTDQISALTGFLRRYATLLDQMKRPSEANATRTRLAQLAGSPAQLAPARTDAPPLAQPAPPRRPATTPGR